MTHPIRKLIGHITIDSGQFVIVDPRYLAHWQDTEFQDIRRFKNADGKVLQYGVDFDHFQSPIESEGGKCMNQLLDAGTYQRIPTTLPRYGLDYNSACFRTIDGSKGGELAGRGAETAVASRTAWGDGRFPVYRVEDSAGNLLRVEISFEEEEE